MNPFRARVSRPGVSPPGGDPRTPPGDGRDDRGPVITRWSRTASISCFFVVFAGIVLALVPYFAAVAESGLVDLFLYAALACLWNLLAGYAGITSFGQQAYLGVGAYALFLYASAGLDPLLGVPLAALTSAAVAVPVSALLLRLNAGYFAVASWVVAEVFHLLATVSPRVGGNTGVSLPGAGAFDPLLWQAITYWLALALLLATVIGIGLLLRSPFGLDARAVHADPTAAAAAGVSVTLVRRTAYVLGALGTGAAGAILFCHHLYVEPSSIFGSQYSVYMLFMVLIGGLGTLEGPLLGALLFFALQQLLSGYGAWYLVILGAVAVLVTLFAPRGLWGTAAHRYRTALLPIGYRYRR